MKHFNTQLTNIFTGRKTKLAYSLLTLFLLSIAMLSFTACGSNPKAPDGPEESTESSSFISDEGIFAPENENLDPSGDDSGSYSFISDGSTTASENGEVPNNSNTSTSVGKTNTGGGTTFSNSNSGITAPKNPDKGGNNGGSNSGNGGTSNSKPQNPTNPVVPAIPEVPEIPVIKDSITRLPEAEKLAWAEINRRRVAGGVSALNYCDSCEATANKQAKFNTVYLEFDYMGMHGPSECGAVTYYASPNDSAAEVANWLVNGWWGSAGHKANFMDSNYMNGGIAIYKVVRNGITGYMAIFHFDDNQFCCDTVKELDYFNKYHPDYLYKH